MLLPEWRKANGYGGRGKPSNAEMSARAAYVTGGGTIERMATSPPRATRAPVTVTAKTPKATAPTISYDTAKPLWDSSVTYKDEWGQPVAPSAVCINCRPRCSLPWCTHTRPVALGSKGEARIFRYRNGKEYFGLLEYFNTPVDNTGAGV